MGNPPRSKVKGRKKEKRLKKGMNAESKRKNKCRICKSTDHNAARCPKKSGEERLDIASSHPAAGIRCTVPIAMDCVGDPPGVDEPVGTIIASSSLLDGRNE